MRNVVLSLAQLMLASSLLFGQTGVVEGNVTDVNGSSVAAAIVYAHPQDGKVMAMAIPHSQADSNGHYSIRLQYGRWGLIAVRPAEDRAGLMPSFYYGLKTPLSAMNLSADTQTTTLDLQVRRPLGFLVGTVSDASTSQSLNANVEFRWVSEPRDFISGSGLANAEFRVAIPSETPLTMVVSQTGYEDWNFDEVYKKHLVLEPDESMHLDIKLRPKRPTQ